MEQDRKEKAPVPAEVGDRAVVEKQKVAVQDKAADKAEVAARDKAKVEPRGKGKAVDRISRLPLEKGD